MASRDTSRSKSSSSSSKKGKKSRKKQPKLVIQGPPGAEGNRFVVDEDSILCQEDAEKQHGANGAHGSKGSNFENGKLIRDSSSFGVPVLPPEPWSDEQEKEPDFRIQQNSANGKQNGIRHDMQQNGIPHDIRLKVRPRGARPKSKKPVFSGCEIVRQGDTSKETNMVETPSELDLVGPEQGFGVLENGVHCSTVVSSVAGGQKQEDLKVNGHAKKAQLTFGTSDLEIDQSDDEDVTKVIGTAVGDPGLVLPSEVSRETEPSSSEKARERTQIKRSKDRSNGLCGRKDDPDKDDDTTEIKNDMHLSEDLHLEDFETFIANENKSSDSSNRPTSKNPGNLRRETPNEEHANEHAEMPNLELDYEDDTTYGSMPQLRETEFAMDPVLTLHDRAPLQPDPECEPCEDVNTFTIEPEATLTPEEPGTPFSLCQVSDYVACPSEHELEADLDFTNVDYNAPGDDGHDDHDPSYLQMLHRGMECMSSMVGFDRQAEEHFPFSTGFQEPQRGQQAVYDPFGDPAQANLTESSILDQELYPQGSDEIPQESMYRIFAQLNLDDEAALAHVSAQECADDEAGDRPTFEGLLSLMQEEEMQRSAPMRVHSTELRSPTPQPPPRRRRSQNTGRPAPEHEGRHRNQGGKTRGTQGDPYHWPYVRLEGNGSERVLSRRPERVESDGLDLIPVTIDDGGELRRLTQEEDLQSLSSLLLSGRRLYEERRQNQEMQDLEDDLDPDMVVAVQEQEKEYAATFEPSVGQLGAGFDNKTRELCDMELALQLQIEENEREAKKPRRPPRQPYNHRLRQRDFPFGAPVGLPDTEPSFQSRFSSRHQQSMGMFERLQPIQPMQLGRRYPFQTRRRSSEENVEELLPEGLSDYNDFDPNDYEALLELEEKLGDVVHPGLSRTEIELLPVSFYDNSTDGATDPVGAEAFSEEQTCKICMCDYEKGESLRVMPCCHRFHLECIDEWLTRNGVCPVCRVRVKDEIGRT